MNASIATLQYLSTFYALVIQHEILVRKKTVIFFLLCAVPRFTGRWFHLCKVDNLIKAAFEQFVLRAVQKEKQELYDFRGNITINSGSQIRSNPSAEFI